MVPPRVCLDVDASLRVGPSPSRCPTLAAARTRRGRRTREAWLAPRFSTSWASCSTKLRSPESRTATRSGVDEASVGGGAGLPATALSWTRSPRWSGHSRSSTGRHRFARGELGRSCGHRGDGRLRVVRSDALRRISRVHPASVAVSSHCRWCASRPPRSPRCSAAATLRQAHPGGRAYPARLRGAGRGAVVHRVPKLLRDEGAGEVQTPRAPRWQRSLSRSVTECGSGTQSRRTLRAVHRRPSRRRRRHRHRGSYLSRRGSVLRLTSCSRTTGETRRVRSARPESTAGIRVSRGDRTMSAAHLPAGDRDVETVARQQERHPSRNVLDRLTPSSTRSPPAPLDPGTCRRFRRASSANPARSSVSRSRCACALYGATTRTSAGVSRRVAFEPRIGPRLPERRLDQCDDLFGLLGESVALPSVVDGDGVDAGFDPRESSGSGADECRRPSYDEVGHRSAHGRVHPPRRGQKIAEVLGAGCRDRRRASPAPIRPPVRGGCP